MARIERISLRPYRRVAVISDIHGALDYLTGLLERVAPTAEDALIFLGDMVEKGPESLATLRYIMALRERYTVFALMGNCDGWHAMFDTDDPAFAVEPFGEADLAALADDARHQAARAFKGLDAITAWSPGSASEALAARRGEVETLIGELAESSFFAESVGLSRSSSCSCSFLTIASRPFINGFASNV